MVDSVGISEGRQEKGKIITIGIVFVIVMIIGYTLYTAGTGGVVDLVKRSLKIIIWVAILGGLIFVVFKMLQKPKIDLLAKGIDDIVQAGMLSKPPMIRDLYFTGDKEHSEFRVGKVVGYCMIQSYKDLNKIAELTDEQVDKLEKEGRKPSDFIINESCFIFKKMGFPFSLFEKPKVLRCLESEHSQLIGDIKIYAVSMVRRYGYFWTNKAYLDVAQIDISVIREAWRGYTEEFLRDMVDLSRLLLGMNATHQTEMQQRKLLKIPNPMGEQETRQ